MESKAVFFFFRGSTEVNIKNLESMFPDSCWFLGQWPFAGEKVKKHQGNPSTTQMCELCLVELEENLPR